VAEIERQTGLRIDVDGENATILRRKGFRQINDRGRLTGAPFWFTTATTVVMRNIVLLTA
jgi:hypothetical protein